MAADVVRRVQGAAGVGGEQHRLAQHVDDGHAARARRGRGRRRGRRRSTRAAAPARARAANAAGSTYSSRGSAACRVIASRPPSVGRVGTHETRPGGRRTGARPGRTAGSAAACRGTGRPRRPPRPTASAGQRGWKRQPDGIRVGSGISPRSTIGSSPSISGYDGQQGLRVGVLRRGQHLLGGPGLDDPAEVHHRDPVGDVPRQPEVVGDHEDAEAELLAQLEQQRQDLAADRGVEAGDGLVGDQQLAAARASAPAISDPLPLAAGELVRVAQEERLRRPQPGRRQGGGDQLGLGPVPDVGRPACGSGGPRRPSRRRCAGG